MSQPTSRRWIEIKCQSPSCPSAPSGGKTLYRQRLGLISVFRRRSGVVVKGVPVLVRCRCGWEWRDHGMIDRLLEDRLDGLVVVEEEGART